MSTLSRLLIEHIFSSECVDFSWLRIRSIFYFLVYSKFSRKRKKYYLKPVYFRIGTIFLLLKFELTKHKILFVSKVKKNWRIRSRKMLLPQTLLFFSSHVHCSKKYKVQSPAKLMVPQRCQIDRKTAVNSSTL